MALDLENVGEVDGLGLVGFDEEFDPLAVDDMEINQDDMDDDNPYDTVDYPTMRNMPEGMRRDAVFTPERQGGARNAIVSMIKRNPAYRPVLLGIVALCDGGCPSSEISAYVWEWDKDNRSVYAPMTLCRMLERAGALEVELPETAEELEDARQGVAYLEIKDEVDPVWRATEAGLEVFSQLTQGDSFREIILNRDATYLEVYEAVMEHMAQAPRASQEVEDLVGTFDVTRKPRRFGGHFIDMLELTDAIAWKDHAWHLTELGKKMLVELKAAIELKAARGE